MLQPKDTDVRTLFLVFVVLPVVTYFLLEKWSETAKKKEKISLIAEQTAEEAHFVEEMVVGSIISMSSVQNDGLHKCASCLIPASTRCSQCKSVWYCSGRCQITHWRQAHKFECQKLGSKCKISPREGSCITVSYKETTGSNLFEHSMKQLNLGTSDDILSANSNPSIYEIASGVAMNESGKQYNHHSSMNTFPFSFADESLMNENDVERRNANPSDDQISLGTKINDINAHELRMNSINKEYQSRQEITFSDETRGLNSLPEMKRSFKARNASRSRGDRVQKSPKFGVRMSQDNADKS